jgi:hypothetical protein
MLYEAVALGGFPPEVDPVKACTPFSRGDGESYRDHEQSLSERVDRFQLRPRLGDVVYVTELVALLPYLNDSLTRAQLDFDAVLALGADGMKEFARAVPLSDCAAALRHYHHQNLDIAWVANDLADFNTLSTALVFCDVVVTEKQWCDAVRRTDLQRKYGTTMLSDAAELVDVLGD